MTVHGYAFASSDRQDLLSQEATLKAAGCERLHREMGTPSRARPVLAALLSELGEGDVVAVTRVDRLAGTFRELGLVVGILRAKKASLRAIAQSVNTTTAEGAAAFSGALDALLALPEHLRRERQLEGVALAKARGAYEHNGAFKTIDVERVFRLRAESQLGATAIARALGISRASVYRVLASKPPLNGTVSDPPKPARGHPGRQAPAALAHPPPLRAAHVRVPHPGSKAQAKPHGPQR